MTVSLHEVLAAARVHAAPLAAESAGYLLLAVADQVLTLPRVPRAEDVELNGDGSVRLRTGHQGGANAEAAERGVRSLLARTLEVASSVGPGLRRAAERSDTAGLQSIVRELEVALIPVNRSAARRALSRVHRETERAREQGKLDAALAAEVQPVAATAPAAEPSELCEGSPRPPLVASPQVVPAAVAKLASPLPALPVLPLEESALPSPVLPAVAVAEAALPACRLEAVPSPVPSPVAPSAESALTKPEPVVERARERGGSTPRFGTVVTAQTLPAEDADRTERAPEVAQDDEELEITVDLEPPGADAPQPLLDPEPSRLPDVLSAMVQLHTGIEPDEAPTRLRDVVTASREHTPQPEVVQDEWLTASSLQGLGVVEPTGEREAASSEREAASSEREAASSEREAASSEREAASSEREVASSEREAASSEREVASSEREVASSEREAASSEREVASSEREPAGSETRPDIHEALTWSPGPVAERALAEPEPPEEMAETPLPPTHLITEVPREEVPYVAARLEGRSSDVSELVSAFHVSAAPEERELRSALKEMAGLELTPLPEAYAAGASKRGRG